MEHKIKLPAHLEREGVTLATFKRMLKWGWVDIFGQPLTWNFWNAKSEVHFG